jgi:hypothetical protein
MYDKPMLLARFNICSLRMAIEEEEREGKLGSMHCTILKTGNN